MREAAMSADKKPFRSPASIDFTPEDIRVINAFMQEHPNQLIQIPGIRAALAKTRIERLTSADFKTYKGATPGAIEHTLEHNMKYLKEGAALNRPDFLINIIRSLNLFISKNTEMTVLTIGPRTESEIFALVAAGFVPRNIKGLDLISYSDFVDVGDMHDMPYEDNAFDVIMLGWVLGYSKDLPKAVSEIVRVAKPGAFVAVGHEHNPFPREIFDEQRGFSLEGTEFKDTNEILEPFGGHVETVLFRQDIHPSLKDVICHLMVVFQLNSDKKAPS
jgi:hypothetical protein